MQTQIKQAILKYFKNCIEEDSKESLKIDLTGKGIYFPGQEENYLDYVNNEYDEKEKNNFYKILGVNQENFDENFLIGFFVKTKIKFDESKKNIQNGGKYELNGYIKYENNWLRIKLINELNSYKKLLELELPNLEKEDLKELFFSPDKGKDGIFKIHFKPNLNFIDFYDNNKNESFYLGLEYIKTNDQGENGIEKENIITPLYLIGIEIFSNEDASFELSLKESEPDFLYNIENEERRSIFTFASKDNGDDGLEEKQNLENNIKGITSSFQEKINYYKSKISIDIDQEKEFIFNPCIIVGANNIKIIKNLIADYNGIIKNIDSLEDFGNNSLGFLFDKKEIEINGGYNNFVNITELNQEQENIIKDSLNQNISVVIGPPGTGKSQVVLNLLTNIYLNNQTVIFASKNNTAVNTVLDKLEKNDFPYYPFLRLGNQATSKIWSEKTLSKLNKNIGIHKKYYYKDIEKQKEKIQNTYDEISNIEKQYLDYYQEYEKFELLLGEISDEKIKDLLYKYLPLKINFKLLKNQNNENNEYIKNIFEIEKSLNELNITFQEFINKLYDKYGEEVINNISTIIEYNIDKIKNDFINNNRYFVEKINTLEKELNKELKNISSHYNDIMYISSEFVNFLYNEDFITDNNLNYTDLSNNFKIIDIKLLEINTNLENYNLENYFSNKKIDTQLIEILKRGNFINYLDNTQIELKKIGRTFIEIEEYGFFKRFFGIKRKNFKKSYNNYLDIVNDFNNSLIKNYFINIKQDNSTDSKDILSKIESINLLFYFEETYNLLKNAEKEQIYYLDKQLKFKGELKDIFGDYFIDKNFSKIGNDLKNIKDIKNRLTIITGINEIIEKIEKEKQDITGKYNVFISDLSKILFIEFNTLDYDEIIYTFDLLNNIKRGHLEINELKNKLNKAKLKYDDFIKTIYNELEKTIHNDLLDYIKKSSVDLSNIFTVLFSFEELNNIKYNITLFLEKLENNQKNISNLSEQILEEQKVLKKLSIEYFQYNIYENIKDYKPQITDSIEGIYDAYSRIQRDIYNDEKRNIFYKDKYEKLFGKINIFVTTNQSTGNLPLEKSFFDYLIIDEASQNDLASIIPLMYRCKKIIIIGDPDQLQNIVKLKEESARKIFNQKLGEINIDPKNYENEFKTIYNFGKNDSYTLSAFNAISHIYEGFSNLDPFQLKEHYRCYPEIINFSNIIIKKYDLFPKSYIKNINIDIKQTPLGIHWWKDIKSDTTKEEKQNTKEAKEIIEYLKELYNFYGDKISIGVISPYRNQVNLLNSLWNNFLRQSNIGETKNILINTVHKFQGDEKDIILYSPVYPKASINRFSNDKNLLNVAVSRAKSAFYIFGDKNAVSKIDNKEGKILIKKLLDYINIIDKQKEKEKELLKINNFDTNYELFFFKKLKEANIKFDYHALENNGKYELDFKLKLKGFNNYINIELDGNSHDNKKSFDNTRNVIVEKLGYKVIRYTNKYLMANIGEIIESLKKVCELENEVILEDLRIENKTEKVEKKKFNYKEFVNNKYGKNTIQFESDKILIIEEAIKDGKNIKFSYKNQKGEISKREIKIIEYGEFENEGIKYIGVKGFCKLRNEERIFNLRKMRYIELER